MVGLLMRAIGRPLYSPAAAFTIHRGYHCSSLRPLAAEWVGRRAARHAAPTPSGARGQDRATRSAMSVFVPELIARHTFDTGRLVGDYPAVWQNANKRLVHQIACPAGCVHSGQLVFSRWKALSLPDCLDLNHATVLEARQDVFGYEPTPTGAKVVEWYLNFAHWDLFCSYGGGLFAQDEMQVAEHPALGSLREALLALNIPPFTVDINEPTPILIQGAERRVAVATDDNAAEGRPGGLYGNRFAAASAEAIERACRVIEPPTVTNVIAMEAPVGSGVYSQDEIVFVLRTACTGFSA